MLNYIYDDDQKNEYLCLNGHLAATYPYGTIAHAIFLHNVSCGYMTKCPVFPESALSKELLRIKEAFIDSLEKLFRIFQENKSLCGSYSFCYEQECFKIHFMEYDQCCYSLDEALFAFRSQTILQWTTKELIDLFFSAAYDTADMYDDLLDLDGQGTLTNLPSEDEIHAVLTPVVHDLYCTQRICNHINDFIKEFLHNHPEIFYERSALENDNNLLFTMFHPTFAALSYQFPEFCATEPVDESFDQIIPYMENTDFLCSFSDKRINEYLEEKLRQGLTEKEYRTIVSFDEEVQALIQKIFDTSVLDDPSRALTDNWGKAQDHAIKECLYDLADILETITFNCPSLKEFDSSIVLGPEVEYIKDKTISYVDVALHYLLLPDRFDRTLLFTMAHFRKNLRDSFESIELLILQESIPEEAVMLYEQLLQIYQELLVSSKHDLNVYSFRQTILLRDVLRVVCEKNHTSFHRCKMCASSFLRNHHLEKYCPQCRRKLRTMYNSTAHRSEGSRELTKLIKDKRNNLKKSAQAIVDRLETHSYWYRSQKNVSNFKRLVLICYDYFFYLEKKSDIRSYMLHVDEADWKKILKVLFPTSATAEFLEPVIRNANLEFKTRINWRQVCALICEKASPERKENNPWYFIYDAVSALITNDIDVKDKVAMKILTCFSENPRFAEITGLSGKNEANKVYIREDLEEKSL